METTFKTNNMRTYRALIQIWLYVMQSLTVTPEINKNIYLCCIRKYFSSSEFTSIESDHLQFCHVPYPSWPDDGTWHPLVTFPLFKSIQQNRCVWACSYMYLITDFLKLSLVEEPGICIMISILFNKFIKISVSF